MYLARPTEDLGIDSILVLVGDRIKKTDETVPRVWMKYGGFVQNEEILHFSL